MFQQARFASLGEMLNNIAHQWRQPLGSISMIIQSFQTKMRLNKLSLDFVEQKVADFGILVCGSGNGVCITANKHAGIRAALCWNTEVAVLAKSHNDANIICLPARFISEESAFEMVDAFFATSFEGGRHQNRVNKINC